jgi:hypothetical protein
MLQGGLLGVFNHWSNLDESSILDEDGTFI